LRDVSIGDRVPSIGDRKASIGDREKKEVTDDD